MSIQKQQSPQCSCCDNPAWARGYCRKHYQRWYLHGDPNYVSKNQRIREAPLYDRLSLIGWTVQESGCWEWSGSRYPRGYGRVPAKGTTLGAHRVAYEAWVGPIPKGLLVRHKCDNPPCINPEHLEVGTNLDNMKDKVTRGRQVNTKPRAKLNASQVERMRQMYSNGVSAMEVWREFPITGYTNVHMVLTGKTWKDLDRGEEVLS